MKKGKGLNLQALTECVCYLAFAAFLFYLVRSGQYLNYVTPRMKPYLYGMSVLMLLWMAEKGRFLLEPIYQVNLARCMIFLIPMLLLMPSAQGNSSDMMGYYGSSGFLASGKQNVSGKSETEETGTGGDTGEMQIPLETTGQDDTENFETDDTSEASADQYLDKTEDEAALKQSTPWYELTGMDEASKTIQISDEDYYTWMYELSNSYEKYAGWTVSIKGFVYRDPELENSCDFAVVRLAMWCCAADLSPMGFLVYSDEASEFPDDTWVTVTGTLGITEDGNSITLQAQKIEAAEKPEEEYIYPYF